MNRKINIPRQNEFLTFERLDTVPARVGSLISGRRVANYAESVSSGSYAEAAGAEYVKQLKVVVGKHDFGDKKLAEVQAIPTIYELSQNFPNPFKPATTIRYGLPKADRVTLKVYNLIGGEAVTMVDDEQKAAGKSRSGLGWVG